MTDYPTRAERRRAWRAGRRPPTYRLVLARCPRCGGDMFDCSTIPGRGVCRPQAGSASA